MLKSPKERSVEETEKKFNLVHAARYFGKSYDAAQKLYHEIQKAEKTILFKTTNGDVHILPQKKLDELLQAERQRRDEAVREALEEAGNFVDELYQSGNMGENEYMLLTDFFDEKFGTQPTPLTNDKE